MDRIRRSWVLTKESWAVLRADKTLLLFPIISTVALLLIMASFAVPTVLYVVSLDPAARESFETVTIEQRIVGAVILFAFYFCTFTVMNYFNVALVGAALERFAGRDAGVRVGLSIATQRIPQILAWSLLAATVGVVLKFLEERLGVLGRIVIGLVGMAWAIATFFVVPVLAAEGVGPIDALKRSVTVLKKSWGEAALTRLGVGAVFGLGIFLVVLIGAGLVVTAGVVLGSVVLSFVIGAVVLLIVVALGLVSTTLQTILQAAVYRYAVDGAAPQGFSVTTLRGMFEPKKKKK